MAQESALLQSLQVKQQLGVQALSIANQAPQTILSLFTKPESGGAKAPPLAVVLGEPKNRPLAP